MRAGKHDRCEDDRREGRLEGRTCRDFDEMRGFVGNDKGHLTVLSRLGVGKEVISDAVGGVTVASSWERATGEVTVASTGSSV